MALIVRLWQPYSPQLSFGLFKRFVLMRSSQEGFLLMRYCDESLRWLKVVIDALDRSCMCAKMMSDTYPSARVRDTVEFKPASVLMHPLICECELLFVCVQTS